MKNKEAAQAVVRALVGKFGIAEDRARAILDANARDLATVVIPADVGVFGYIGADGSSDVMLVAGDRVICGLRIPA